MREGLTAIISVSTPIRSMKDRQRRSWGNSEVRKIVSSILGEQLDRFFMENPETARLL